MSNDSWKRFDVQDKSEKKQVGLYEIKNIDNLNILAIAINAKEYFEKYKDYSINKKHKSVKKNTPDKNFEVYSERLATLHEHCFPKKIKRIKQKRFQVVNESMRMKSVNKTQFAKLNNKRYSFHNGIVSLPFGHFLLEKARKETEKYHSKLHTEVKK